MKRDLHRCFSDPRHVPADELVRFLEEADRLPDMRAVQKAMREAIDPRPGMRLLDAGCGVGLETARLAEQHPDLHVTGLDRNGELLEIARRRAPQVEWLEARPHGPRPPTRVVGRRPGQARADRRRRHAAPPHAEPAVWRRIVKDTVIAGSPDPEVADWLEQQEDAAARGEFVAAFTGMLIAATRPRPSRSASRRRP